MNPRRSRPVDCACPPTAVATARADHEAPPTECSALSCRGTSSATCSRACGPTRTASVATVSAWTFSILKEVGVGTSWYFLFVDYITPLSLYCLVCIKTKRPHDKLFASRMVLVRCWRKVRAPLPPSSCRRRERSSCGEGTTRDG